MWRRDFLRGLAMSAAVTPAVLRAQQPVVPSHEEAASGATSSPSNEDTSVTDRMRDFDSDGVNIRYLAAGRGEPVVLLHGFVFSMRPAWIDSGFLSALSQTNRVVALDLRGHGESGKPHDPASYGVELIRDVLRLIDYLEFDRVHLVGYSLGGTLGLRFLELAPERLLSLVVGGAGWVREGDSTYRSWIPLAAMLEQVRPGERLSDYFWPNPSTRPPREVLQIVDSNDPAALAALARSMLDVVVTHADLRSNRVATLAVCGEQDPVRPSVEAMKGIVGNLELQIFPGLDHHSLPASAEFRDSIFRFIRVRK
jgi:pimeloyl-ACP methyl ester carboxylesterase